MKKKIQSLVSKLGYYIFRPAMVNGSTKFTANGFSYDTNIPRANFAPWDNDIEFQNVYNIIQNNTLVDIYRCYELWKLVSEASKLHTNLNILEVGVWRGGTAGIMAKKLEIVSKQGKIYLADTFEGVVKTSELDNYYSGKEHNDTSIEVVESLLSNIGVHNYKILQGIFPDDTAKSINNDIIFGICHIDVDIYLSAKDILNWVWDKLAVGGIIVFDDYGFHTCNGITKLVEEQRAYSDRIVIHNLNGHGILFKIS